MTETVSDLFEREHPKTWRERPIPTLVDRSGLH